MTETERTDEAAPQVPADEAAPLRARLTELEAALEHERDQATNYMKRWQYAEAELANQKRRHQQEREELGRLGPAPLAAALLEVLDNFERAEQTLPPALRSYTWIGGVLLIHRQLDYLLQQVGLEAVQTAEQRYDPSLHEAVTQEHHETVPEGVVIAEVQRGYRLHGRLLRPALVRVSQGPAPQQETPAPTDQPAETPVAAEQPEGTPQGSPADAPEGA